MEMKNYSVGFARLDTTPQLGVQIGGYFTKRYGKGVLDPLYVRAMAFSDGEKTAVLLVLDQCNMGGKFGSQWPADIAQKLGLPAEAVMIQCTHSHTTALLGADEMYDAWLFRRLCDAATMAINDCKPVADVQWGQGEVPNHAYVRRWFLTDGTLMTNPAGKYLEMLDHPEGDGDDSVRLIRILREEGPEIAIVNFQNHPDNIGGEFYSADFPGVMCKKLEQERENTVAIFLNGTQGQLNATNRRVPKLAGSYEKAAMLGEKLAAAVLPLFEKTVSTEQVGLSYGQKSVQMKTKRDPSRYEESKRIRKLFSEGRLEEIHPFVKIANYMAAEAGHLVRLEEAKLDYQTATVSAMTFCGVAFAGFPAEPFCEVGKMVRAASRFPVTCACCLTNGTYGGYLPMEACFPRGGYEVYQTPYVRGTAEQLANTAIDLLAEL